MTSKTTITADELVAHLAELRLSDTARPKGYYTTEEMSWQLVDEGKCETFAQAKSRIDRLMKVLHHEHRLEVIHIHAVGPTGRRYPCAAFKILPARKGK